MQGQGHSMNTNDPRFLDDTKPKILINSANKSKSSNINYSNMHL